tara:strand:- start:13149 stop:13385 length:237 start_codon:yes stop_codon:yes gene_type:complete
MTNTSEQTFCNCFGCDRGILVGEKVHSLTYTYEKISTPNMVSPIYAEGLGTWCDDCFSKLKKDKNYQVPWEHIPDQTE